MKKIFIMLLIACSTTIVNAQTAKSRKTSTDNSPYPIHVMETLNEIDKKWGDRTNRHFEVNRNPNTGIIESRQQIDHFKCGINSPELLAVSESFLQDEPKSYQFLLIKPGKEDLFQLTVPTKDPLKVNHLNIRTSSDQEMWLMCCKNPDNPQLRDAYAIVWKKINNTGEVEGDIFKITSVRPDILEEKMMASRKTFKIEGRVDADIKDSLYNIYIADSYDELSQLDDDDYVACVPVVNKRFEYTVELDKPKAGRLRCIFPDGSLCSAWINLDMVPGETYRITVHNGYFDEDRDYENRVGRWSGKSLISGYDNDDSPIVADTVAADLPYDEDQFDELQNEMRIKAADIMLNIDRVEALYKIIGEQLKRTIYTGEQHPKWSNLDEAFDNITKENKKVDKKLKGILKFAQDKNVEKSKILNIYENLMAFYTGQNKHLNEAYTKYGYLSKSAEKCQKNIINITEKYMREARSLMYKK